MNSRFLIILGIFILIDLYFFQAISTLLKNAPTNRRNIVNTVYWSITGLTISLFLFHFFYSFRLWNDYVRIYLTALLFCIMICKLIGSIILLADDSIRLLRWAGTYLFPKTAPDPFNPHAISRMKFLSQMAVLLASIPFVSMMYGMVKSGYDIRLRKVKIKLSGLPAAFEGLKIIQISDIHCGTFTSAAHFENAIQIIQKEKPDVIFFTGDLVNDVATETEKFHDTFKKMSAPLGVYSILGNHDYGDYVQWETAEEKAKNLESLENIQKSYGWKLLRNEHTTLKRGKDEIAIIGVENWGKRGFVKHGNLKKAYSGAEKYPVKILLSHDPSHWEAEVLENYKDIELTLSGHTHGMQFGVEIPGFKWSPVQYFYKQWAGLYEEGHQKIYVNRGLGFIGYPGRVGILPEITLLQLNNRLS